MSSSPEVFRRFLRRVLVETGTFIGNGVQSALDAGFEQVYSIEASPNLYERALKRFTNDPRVTLVLGRSEVELAHILEEVFEPATIWLDAHNCWEGLLEDTDKFPLHLEIAALSKAPIRTHIVLVDDVRDFATMHTSVEEVQDRLRQVNPDYQFSFLDGVRGAEGFLNDILVAERVGSSC